MNRLRRRKHDFVEQFGQHICPERPEAREQFIHHRAQRIEIGTAGYLLRLHLFGRHVTRRPGYPLDGRHLTIVQQRDPEIDDPDVVVRRQHDVAGFDIAMNQSAAMRIVQRFRALEDDLYHVVDPEQVIGFAVGRQRAGTLHMLHHHVVTVGIFARVIDRQNIRVLQLTHDLRFVEKHLARDLRILGVGARVSVVNLDCNIAAVIGIMREIHVAGGPFADLGNDLVFPDPGRYRAWDGFVGHEFWHAPVPAFSLNYVSDQDSLKNQ